jgi:hypothetical protein
MYEVERCEMVGLGLISIARIQEKLPKVRLLDLRFNKIYSYDAMEQLKLMKKLQSI